RVAVLVLLAGCLDGSFALEPLRPPPASPQGASCTEAAECASGVCADGVCCARACEASASCAAPGRVGLCTPREPGSPCTEAAQCPTGFCVDGVCCRSACEGACTTCAGRAPGTCAPAADNTDLRRECGTCSACFGGTCAPAEVGTDPNGACGSGRRCGTSQTCGLVRGAGCAADADCAVGYCIAGRCENPVAETIPAGPLVDTPTRREVVDAASDRDGGLAALFWQYSAGATNAPPVENQLVLAKRSAAGAWTVTPLHSSLRAVPMTGAVAFLGRWGYVASYNFAANEGKEPACAREGGLPCGLFGQLVLPSGQLGGYESIDAEVRLVHWVRLLARPDGALLAVYGEDRGYWDTVRLRRRDPVTRAWSEPVVLTENAIMNSANLNFAVSQPSVVVSGRLLTLYYAYDRTLPGGDSALELHARTVDLGEPDAPFEPVLRPDEVAPLPVPDGGTRPCNVSSSIAGAALTDPA
ncbi:MAG: hypothetical protein ACK4N5_07190, partial [Myxococcales bacterium]